MENKTVSDSVVEILRSENIDTVFSIIATSIMDLFDALAREPAIQVIPVQHEQAAAFMSDGYARVTGRPSVCLLSAGPGATNAITGVAQAYHESAPVVVISSETSTYIHGRGRSNFHEVDQLALFKPITKWAVRAERADRVPELMRRAFLTAVSGRPGPVYVGIPKDFLLASATSHSTLHSGPAVQTRTSGNPDAMAQAAELLSSAERPFILAGGGVIWSGAREQLRLLAERLVAPVAATPWHRGIVSDDHPLGVGQLGNTGSRPALTLVEEADVIVVIGSTLSELTTDRYGHNIIPRSARIIQIDIDPEEVGRTYPVEVGLVGDARTILGEMLSHMDDHSLGERDWQAHPRAAIIAKLKAAWDEWLAEIRGEDSHSPIGRLTIYHELRGLLEHDAIVVAESGGTAAFTRFAFPAYEPQIFPGDYSAMGSGYCIALGAKVAHPERQVVSLDGDGAFMMVLPELQTAVENEINTLSIIFHNDSYSNMKYKQTELFESRYLGVEFKYPDFAQIARDFGAWGERIETADQLKDAITRGLAAGKPAVLDVMTDPNDQVPPSDIYQRWIKERQMPTVT